jgi:hypothetical protein
MLSCSIWFCAPSFWMGCDLDSRCVGRVDNADVAALHILMLGVCSRNMSSQLYIHKITLLHQVVVSNYFMSCKV